MFENFVIEYNGTKVYGDVTPPGTKPEILILHGAGSANRARYTHLRELLASVGFSSAAFDYIGHGETSGELQGSTLEDRTEQTLEVINFLKASPQTVLGSSMGAYTAIKLLEKFPIENLILFVPAIYSDESYTIPFGPQFTSAIKKQNSWEQSCAWELLKSFKGNLLLVAAEKDDVIPQALIDRIYQSAENCAAKEIYTIKGAPHSFTRFLSGNTKQLTELSDKIINFVKL